jgi:hypothetical protein
MAQRRLRRIFALGLLRSASSFTALGSTPPATCDVHIYECPSHFLCSGTDLDAGGAPNQGTCICDHFFGFEGAHCRGKSAAWYLLSSLCSVVVASVLYALRANFTLMRQLQTAGRLKANVIGRTLIFNVLSLLPVLGLNLGFLLILTEVDRQMAFYQHVRELLIALLFVLFIVSWLSVSVYWLEMAERMATKRHAGSSSSHFHSARAKRHAGARYRAYRASLYGASLLAGGLVVASNVLFHSTVFVVISGVAYSLAVGFSYHVAGGRIVKLLDVTLSSGGGGRQGDVAKNIRCVFFCWGRGGGGLDFDPSQHTVMP